MICDEVKKNENSEIFTFGLNRGETLPKVSLLKTDEVLARIATYEFTDNIVTKKMKYHDNCFLKYTYV